MDYAKILLKPVVSEKANEAKEQSNHVSFYVHPDSNKVEVKKAVEAAFGVKVESVNIVRKKAMPRMKMGRATGGRIPGYKKAYVKLAAGDKIEIFEGV
ncbi:MULTISPECIES: 50S ribosomal protein L23 [unclassified Pseudodesulfovibrio]|jgi:large subunit ribosomal protein L23|uniref:50S ribosomal protein L23 n=1 Tax=unclassified Pseudodesulfovibrio TaxID=2661612 RepID=UPI000FEB9692|nr:MULTISPECIES: 50S ribosomal protein L23 [unclassified Pseudodesulfovibrio]MCJ2163056.1 50S ribosomal protein L23 [Pseudodesulfovibrio sp. S3-i]RWU07049.1 50S ribosomal protein L23 [Pseudodesulfovibrio sp. S3]